ncbi:acylneuraminate cytidylyltransferase family protein [Seonamhaeicola sp. MEBiC1930]|uniref:acylneuraminate cytidylyltransferase family protein n=1 Tax=Seonamhaeicola sp. MEBiC01930 TaxID=2976768 RepID=UPI003246B279
MKVLGIIPARGGSKGVKNKNIRLLDGEPLLTYAINAAKESKLLTDYIVTSDDDNILKVATSHNCKAHKRNVENAQDHSPIEDVVIELLNFLEKQYDLIVLLQPTAPLRTGLDIDNVISMFNINKTLNNVVSVIELEDIHPARMYQINELLDLIPLNSEDEKTQRQKLSKVYLRNGCIYATKTKAFLEHKSLILEDKKAYVMPQETWANIDTERDFLLAEALMKYLKSNKNELFK